VCIDAGQIGAWYADVDYLRLTSKPGVQGEDILRIYGSTGRAVVGALGGGEVEVEEWGWLGYRGQRGRGVSWGASSQGQIIQASGRAAPLLASYALPWDNCSRIDVQVTVFLREYDARVAKRAADEVWNDGRAKRGRKVAPRYIDGYGKGDTAYIGARSSAQFTRIYDKQLESGNAEEWPAAWRFEVEFKDDMAPTVWEATPRGGDRSAWAAGVVLATLEGQGVQLPALAPHMRRMPAGPGDEDSASERRLKWIATQVRPSIDKLLASGVRPEYLRELLGLSVHTDTLERDRSPSPFVV